MPTYSYEALNAAGKPQKGSIEAKTADEAVQRIKSQGFFPTSVREQKIKGGGGAAGSAARTKAKKKRKGFSLAFGRVALKRMTLFTRQLSTLQDAGLPLLRSIQVLEQQQKPGRLKNILSGVAEDVESGSSLSDAMAKHPAAFDRLYCKMVNAGEIGGVLDVILQRLADFMEKADRLRRRIKSALIYPSVVITIAVLIVTGIMYFVIPKFQEIFNDFD
ncbi:MAG: type II secretion system F family protein, partial [Phycisphaerales bacterium]